MTTEHGHRYHLAGSHRARAHLSWRPRLGPRPGPVDMRGRQTHLDGSLAFCERCGLDSERLGSAGETAFRTCPDCLSSSCANCWNQVAGGCLSCRPFSLPGAAPARPRWVGAVLVGAQASGTVEPEPSRATRARRRGAAKPRTTADRPVAAAAPTWPADAAVGSAPVVAPVVADDRRRGNRPIMGLMTLAAVAVVALVAFRVLGPGPGRPVAAELGVTAGATPTAATLAPSSEAPGVSSLPSAAPVIAVVPAEDPSEPPSERPSHYHPSSTSHSGSSGGGGSSGGSGGGSTAPPATGTPTATDTPGATPGATPTDTPTATASPTCPSRRHRAADTRAADTRAADTRTADTRAADTAADGDTDGDTDALTRRPTTSSSHVDGAPGSPPARANHGLTHRDGRA